MMSEGMKVCEIFHRNAAFDELAVSSASALSYDNDIDKVIDINTIKNNRNLVFNKSNEAYNKLPNIKEGDNFMENNDYIIKLIDKVEESNRQLKSDLVESEKRMTLDRIESEKRIVEERRLSEERMEKRFIETMHSIKILDAAIDSKINKIENKIDSKIDKLESKYETLKWWILGTCLATILAVAALVKT